LILVKHGFYQTQDMDETLRQVGELLLGSVPTIVFLVLLYGIYTALVHKPLVKVLAVRHDKTEGAIEKARADIAVAEARTAEYEQRLREARMTVFKHREALRQQALQGRAAALAETRKKAQAQVEEARAAIDKDKVAAQAVLQEESGKLAAEIMRIVLQPGTTHAPLGGGR
jgi:F-type H+-transporting ATPase subunit b